MAEAEFQGHFLDRQQYIRSLIPALPFCHVVLRQKRQSTEYPITINSLGDHLKKRRLDLGLQMEQTASRLGCHPASVANWERNRTTPGIAHLPRVLGFLGYDPRPIEANIGAKLKRHREAAAGPRTTAPRALE